MSGKKSFIKSMFTDCKTGDVSSKRVIGFIGFVSLLAIMFINALYSKSVSPSRELIDAIQYIVIATIVGTSAEKFVKDKGNDGPTI